MSADHVSAGVLISGGGLIGQTLALALAAHGLSSIIVDSADPVTALKPEFDGRASAIASASWRMMEAIGIADTLRPHGCAIERIWVSDGLKPGELDFAPAPEDGFLGIMLENRRLRLVLSEAVATNPLVTLLAPVQTTGMERDAHRVTLSLADGRSVTAPMIAVCEGRRSATRDMAGISIAHWDYHHTAMVGAIAHETPHDQVAYEIFYPSGPFALLPLNDLDAPSPNGLRHRCAFVWSMGKAEASARMKLGPRGLKAELLRHMGGLLGDIEEIASRSLYPLGYQRAARVVAERLTLVGDAAHGIHPIAGQGFNLGLRDVATLVEVLVEGSRLGLDLGDAQLLARYGRWRGLDTLSVGLATDGLARLFGVPGKAASAVRRFGLGAVQRSGALKDFFMNEARGESGDLPRLLAGALV
jgi:2-octaprenyl-6-methoxyphenol hydroxylase